MKWYDEINDVIDERDKRCEINGESHGYVVPKGAFHTKSRAMFEKRFPFNSKKDCKIRRELTPSIDADENNRYYPTVTSEKGCKKTKGVWESKQPNRFTRYGRGTCFTNKDDALCSIHSIPELIRRDKLGIDKNMLYTDAKRNCNTDPNCTWLSNDCMRKELEEPKLVGENRKRKSVLVENPPLDMPKDVTNKEIEQFLYDWYIDGDAPATRDLFGEGDRCNPSKPKPTEDKDEITKIDPMTTKDYLTFIKGWDKVVRTDALHPDMQSFLEKIGFLDIDYAMKMIRRPTDHKELLKLKKEINDDYQDYIEHINLSKEHAQEEQEPEPTGFLPSLPQSVVNIVMKHIALTNSSNRGLMALHSTGSGKTCTAAGVMDAFWDTTRQIIFASSIDAIAANPPFKFHECALRLFPRFKRIGKTMEQTAQLFKDRNIGYLPFAKLANRITKTEKFKSLLSKTKSTSTKITGVSQVLIAQAKIHQPKYSEEIIASALKQANLTKLDDYVDLDNAVLVIDEVHNLFRPLPTQREKHKLVEKHIADPKAHPNLKVVILSATPGDNTTDTVKLLNIVRDPTHPPITAPNIDDKDSVEKFRESIRGMISFFDMSNDTTQFPTVKEQPITRLPMSARQFERYLEAYKEVKDGMKDYDKLAKSNQLNKYWQGPRKYSNMLFNFEKGMKLTEFSSKLPVLLERVQTYPKEKHYIYSSFYEARGSSQGILEIARQFESMGYTKLTVKEAKAYNKEGQLPPKGKRYILALQKEIGEEGSSSAGNNLNELIKIYNHRENRNGELIHAFLATQGFNEGLDLKAVRHIHFFEPLVTMASDLQTIGRARRYCSHGDLDRDKNEWTVMLHRYITDLPLKASFENIETLQKTVEDQKQKIEYMAGKFATLSKKDADYASIKSRLSDEKKQLKELESRVKKAIKEDTSKVKAIDEFIYNNAQERMRELFTIHQSIKEAAIDCRLLNKFHNAMSPTPFTCVGPIKTSNKPDGQVVVDEPKFKEYDDIPSKNMMTEAHRIIKYSIADVDLSGMDLTRLKNLMSILQPVLNLPEMVPDQSMMDYLRSSLILKPEQFADLISSLINNSVLLVTSKDPDRYVWHFKSLYNPERQKHFYIMLLVLGLLGEMDSLLMRQIMLKYEVLYDKTVVLIGKQKVTDKDVATYKKIAQDLSTIFSEKSKTYSSPTVEWTQVSKRFENMDNV